MTVLCIDGSSSGAGRLMLAGLLARADGTSDEDYRVLTAQWPEFPDAQLDQADVVVLTDVPEVTADQARRLAQFVRRGNGLVWFAGKNVKVQKWNQLSGEGGDALLPGKLGPAVDARDSLGVGKPLDPAMPDHPVCRPLASLPEDLLTETRYLKRLSIEPAKTSYPVLNLAGSHSPILLERALGRGHVFLFTTSADTAWNNMALTPVFPMLMQQIVTYLAGREFEQPRVVGDALTLAYVQAPDASDAVFDTPSKQTITVPVRQRRDQFFALLDRAQEAGFYLARVSVQAPGMPIAVNVDTRESDVACLSNSELADSLGDTGITVCTSGADLSAQIQQSRTGRTAWRYVLIAGLVLLVAEALFADRILGRRQRRAAPASSSPQPMGVA